MADIQILTEHQQEFLCLVGEEKYLLEHFYFTGGTPLAAFYLHHRLSEDIDLFSEEEINLSPIQSFIKKAQATLTVTKVEYRQYLGLHIFQLHFPDGTILKVDFNYYPFTRIEKGMEYGGIAVDSLLDIAANKTQTIGTTPRARDFIDLYFIIKEKGYDFRDLLAKARIKFDWHIDPVQFGSRLLSAADAKDYPRMIKKIDPQEWQNFFIEEAKKLKGDILAD